MGSSPIIRFTDREGQVGLREWEQAQQTEQDFWDDCANTYQEETKQLTVAEHLGLVAGTDRGRWPVYDLAGGSVADFGGGPISLLLKCINGAARVVVDPLTYPEWVYARYHRVGIETVVQPAETFAPKHRYDEVWIYNTLQHVQDPERVVAAARATARQYIRIFEWVDIPPHEGHPHMLNKADLDRWLRGPGTTELLPRFGGIAYYGVFTVES